MACDTLQWQQRFCQRDQRRLIVNSYMARIRCVGLSSLFASFLWMFIGHFT